MYKLYSYMPEPKLLDVDFDEGKIIDALAENIYKVEFIHFLVLLQTEDRMIPYKTILSEKDYFDWIAEYIEKEEKEYGYCRKRELK